MPALFQREWVVAISKLRVTAGWEGMSGPRRRNDAIYSVPKGYGVLNVEAFDIHNNNGEHSVSSFGEGLDLLAENEVRYVFTEAIKVAGERGDDNLKGQIELQQDQLIHEIDRYKSTSNVVQAVVSASPSGSAIDRKRGWCEMSVKVELIFLGGTTNDQLAVALEQQWGIDIPLMGN